MMDFSDLIRAHAKRVAEMKGACATEAAAKQSLIVPFFRVLGYDPDDPNVVIPEYTADFGNKKECKVDYAIKHGEDIVIIVEAKKVGDSLEGSREGQLQQYFMSLLPVKIAILTDGVKYKFYTDLDHENVMDKKPFMTFDFAAVDETLIPELKKLCNEGFDLDTARAAAQELKYLGQLKKRVAEEMSTPSDDLVRLFAKRVYDGMLTTKVLEEFKGRVKLAFDNHIREVVNARLDGGKIPLKPVATDEPPSESGPDATPTTVYGNVQGDGIETTAEEVEAYHIVKSILRETVEPERILLKDGVNYASIVLDSSRKVICRMHFNAPRIKHFETLDMEAGINTKHEIDLKNLNSIYQHAAALKATVAALEAKYRGGGKGKEKDADNA